MNSDTKPDVLAESLLRIGTGELPRSSFELLHHPKTRAIVIQATRETMSDWNLEAALLKEAPMNPVRLHDILTTWKGFQGRDPEAAEGIITADFVASIERQVAKCLTPRNPGDMVHDLLSRLPTITDELMTGNHPMTLAEVKLFEERTRGKFQVHRDAIAKDGKKPEYTGLTWHEKVVQIMHQSIGNTVWINLMLAAIEADDYEAIPALLADAKVGKRERDIDIIMKFILHDPALQVSPSMLNALVDQHNDRPTCLHYVELFLRQILNNRELNCYRGCIAHIGQLGMKKVTDRDSGWFLLEVCQSCSKDEIRGILQIDYLTNTMRDHLKRAISVAIQLLQGREGPVYQIQIDLLREIATEFQIELSASVK